MKPNFRVKKDFFISKIYFKSNWIAENLFHQWPNSTAKHKCTIQICQKTPPNSAQSVKAFNDADKLKYVPRMVGTHRRPVGATYRASWRRINKPAFYICPTSWQCRTEKPRFPEQFLVGKGCSQEINEKDRTGPVNPASNNFKYILHEAHEAQRNWEVF